MNSTKRYRQLEPTVAGLSNGGFAVAWEDESKGAFDPDVRARIFKRDGSPLGLDFVVNTTKPVEQSQAAAASLAKGGFVVVWSDRAGGGTDNSGFAVRGQRFDNAGGKLGRQFQVNRITQNDQNWPAVAGLADGGFAAAWDDGSYTGTDPNTYHDVRAQSFRANGEPRSKEFVANTTTYTNQNYPAVAGLSTGNFVVTWDDISQTAPAGSGNQIRAQVFSPGGGKVGKELVVNTTPNWTQRYSSVAGIDQGHFVVAWEDGSHSIDGDYNVRAQIMASSGEKIGGELLVGKSTNNHQMQPAVAAFPNGDFVIVWTDYSASSGDVSESGIRGQVFSRSGKRLGGEFLVNRTTTNAQLNPAVAVTDAKRFVVVWTDGSGKKPDKNAPGIRGQLLGLAN